MRTPIAISSLCALLCACAAKYEPTGDDDNAADDAAAAPDTAPPPMADAAPLPPDAPPMLAYPSGPYGTHTGDVIEDLSWQGFLDTDADADGDHFNEPPHTITLEDFFVGRDPASRVLVLTESAGWCGPCQDEAARLPSFAGDWVPKGARFVTVMIEDSNGSPSDTDYAKSWGDYFELTTPVVADPDDLIGNYNFDGSIPFNIFIDTATMQIVHKMGGWDDAEAESVLGTYAP